MEKIKKIKIFFKNKNILITGNTGFIGSWLTLVLLNLGIKIVGVSKDSGEKNSLFKLAKIKKKIIFYKKNLVSADLKNVIIKNNINIIIHLAADPLVYEGIQNPYKIIKNNVLSTLNVINAIEKRKMLFINFTTDKVYENKEKIKKYFKEDDPLKGDDPYSFSKVSTDMLTEMWSKQSKNIRFINLRCGNVVGGGDWKEKRIVTDIVKNYFENKKLLIRNLNSIRPWIHVLEVCNILNLLIYKLYNLNFSFKSFNISPAIVRKEKITVNKILNIFEKKFHSKFNYRINKQFNEKKSLMLDSLKIKNFLKLNYYFNTKDRFSLTFDWYKRFYNKNDIIEISEKNIEKVKKLFFK
jgi:CDP-glucose 4,6-dehydratase